VFSVLAERERRFRHCDTIDLVVAFVAESNLSQDPSINMTFVSSQIIDQLRASTSALLLDLRSLLDRAENEWLSAVQEGWSSLCSDPDSLFICDQIDVQLEKTQTSLSILGGVLNDLLDSQIDASVEFYTIQLDRLNETSRDLAIASTSRLSQLSFQYIPDIAQM